MDLICYGMLLLLPILQVNALGYNNIDYINAKDHWLTGVCSISCWQVGHCLAEWFGIVMCHSRRCSSWVTCSPVGSACCAGTGVDIGPFAYCTWRIGVSRLQCSYIFGCTSLNLILDINLACKVAVQQFFRVCSSYSSIFIFLAWYVALNILQHP